jgi:hypothetical protein
MGTVQLVFEADCVLLEKNSMICHEWTKDGIVITTVIINSSMTSFFRVVNKRAIYRLGIFSLVHALVHVTDFPVVNVHVDE